MKTKTEQLFKLIFATACAISLLPSTAHAETCELNDSLWLQPRSGVVVLNESTIRPCVLAMLTDNKSKMSIIYNDTDESNISATELRQWLVALALPAERIILKKATTLTEPIRLEIQHD